MRVHKLSAHGITIPEIIVGGTRVMGRDGTLSKIQCNECEKLFSNQRSLRFHIRVKHEKSLPLHTCETCGKECTSRASLGVSIIESKLVLYRPINVS